MDFKFWRNKEKKEIDRIKSLMVKIQKLDPNKEEDYKKIKKYEGEVRKMGKVILKDGKLQKVEDVPQALSQQARVEQEVPLPAPPMYPGSQRANIPVEYQEQEEMEDDSMPIPPMPVNVMRPVQPQVQQPLRPQLSSQQMAYQQQMAAMQQQEIARQQQMAYQQQIAYQQQMAAQQAQESQQQVVVRIVKVNGAIDVSVSMANLENFVKNMKEAMDSQSSFEVGNRIINGRHIIDMILNPE